MSELSYEERLDWAERLIGGVTTFYENSIEAALESLDIGKTARMSVKHIGVTGDVFSYFINYSKEVNAKCRINLKWNQ